MEQANIQSLIQTLIQSFKYGNVIKNGIPTVIAGKPNAGKSTLLNALLNEERSIVSEIAGTTRDTIEEVLTIDGINFRLTDTAGLRKSVDKIENLGIEKTREKISKATLVLYLFDVSKTTSEELEDELKEFGIHDAIIIPVGNKMDLLKDKIPNQLINQPTNQPIYISSLKKENIHSIVEEMRKVVSEQKVKSDIVITNIRHYEALKNADESLQNVITAIDGQFSGEMLSLDIRKAIFHLSEITGEITTEDLLDNIFSKFCIGK